MKKMIVTGCRGQLGIAINKLYEGNREIELVNTDVEELDIKDIDKVMAFVREIKPYAIINYVFAGNGDRPYIEFDATSPLGVYGASKLAGEVFVRDFAKDYFIIRTAWLYGEGKNFVKTMLRLSETNDKVRVVKDQFGTPTSADELAKAIVHLLPTENYGVFHGTCEGFCSWADFTEEIFRLAGKKTVVEAITTQEYEKDNPASAPRPAYSVLDNYMLRLTTNFKFADWHDAIEAYLKKE